jgi:amidophosphoribosyltransferase
MGTRWELIAAQATVDKIRDHIGADSLGYLSVGGLIEAVNLPQKKFCTACFTGDYPSPVPLQMDKLAMEPAAGTRDRHAFEWSQEMPSIQQGT